MADHYCNPITVTPGKHNTSVHYLWLSAQVRSTSLAIDVGFLAFLWEAEAECSYPFRCPEILSANKSLSSPLSMHTHKAENLTSGHGRGAVSTASRCCRDCEELQLDWPHTNQPLFSFMREAEVLGLSLTPNHFEHRPARSGHEPPRSSHPTICELI